MKTLKLLAFLSAAALPVTFAAEMSGVTPVVDSLHVFAAFVATIVVLTMSHDYARPRRLLRVSRVSVGANAIRLLSPAQASHPLAA